jgi:hypothetical protein
VGRRADAARHRRALRAVVKEFTPAMVKAVFDELACRPAEERHFTVGIYDDVTHLSLKWDPNFTHRGRRRV